MIGTTTPRICHLLITHVHETLFRTLHVYHYMSKVMRFLLPWSVLVHFWWIPGCQRGHSNQQLFPHSAACLETYNEIDSAYQQIESADWVKEGTQTSSSHHIQLRVWKPIVIVSVSTRRQATLRSISSCIHVQLTVETPIVKIYKHVSGLHQCYSQTSRCKQEAGWLTNVNSMIHVAWHICVGTGLFRCTFQPWSWCAGILLLALPRVHHLQ